MNSCPRVFVCLLGPVLVAVGPATPAGAGQGSPAASATKAAAAHETATTAPASVVEAPVIESIRIERGGGKARLTVTFSAVPGGTSYNLQVSKALTFTRLVLDITELAGPLRDLNLTPGVYFLRLRAFRGERPGPFSKVEVLNAMVAGDRILRQAGGGQTPAVAASAGGASGSDPAGSAAAVTSVVAPPPPPAPPPLPSSAPTAASPPPPGPGSSPPAAPPPLSPAVLLSEAELARLGPLRPRYDALLAELRDLEVLRRALEANAATLVQRLAGTKDARASAALLDELTSIQSAHHELDDEVERMFRELAALKP